MKIAVLGATGGTGRQVVEQALARGDGVVAYVRNASAIAAKPGLRVISGQLSDELLLTNAINGSDAVLVCLGTYKKKPIDLMQKSLPMIVRAMQHAGVPRLVLLSAYGVGETFRTAGLFARIVYTTMVRSVYRDKRLSEAALPGSGLNWTLVYPVGLTNATSVDAAEVRPMTMVRKVSGLPMVSRADVARVMLDAVSDQQTVGQTLLVSRQGSVH